VQHEKRSEDSQQRKTNRHTLLPTADQGQVPPTGALQGHDTYPGGNLEAMHRLSRSWTRRSAARKAVGTGPCRASQPAFLHTCGNRRKSRWHNILVTPRSKTWSGYWRRIEYRGPTTDAVKPQTGAMVSQSKGRSQSPPLRRSPTQTIAGRHALTTRPRAGVSQSCTTSLEHKKISVRAEHQTQSSCTCGSAASPGPPCRPTRG